MPNGEPTVTTGVPYCGANEAPASMVAIRHLSRAPIVEAAINFRVRSDKGGFSAEDLPKIPATFSTKYPKAVQIQQNQLQVEFDGSGQHKAAQATLFGGFRFHSADDKKVCVMEPEGFLYSHVNSYQTWESLTADAAEALEAYMQALGQVEITRVGLRYINRLRFSGGTDLNEFFTVSPQVPPDLPQAVLGFVSRIVLPAPELGPNGGAILTQLLEPLPRDQGFDVVLDADVFLTVGDGSINGRNVFDRLSTFRDWKNKLFFSAITEKTAERYV